MGFSRDLDGDLQDRGGVGGVLSRKWTMCGWVGSFWLQVVLELVSVTGWLSQEIVFVAWEGRRQE
jgi:hypothetical protein